jgi:hypothetical protein
MAAHTSESLNPKDESRMIGLRRTDSVISSSHGSTFVGEGRLPPSRELDSAFAADFGITQ